MVRITKKAIALFSGGADSLLSIRLMLEQGVELVALYFNNCFFNSRNPKYGRQIRRFCSSLGIPIRIIFLGKEYLRMLAKPSFGYGKGMNPCIDCHIMMLRKAKDLMPEVGAGFVVTGEVVGQRPMSQNLTTLKLIEEQSGLRGRILRPLSAKILPPTIAELTKIIDRSKLLGIEGRTRKAQIELAAKLNVENLPGAAGGCLLTQKLFAAKVKDAFEHAGKKIPSINDVKLLQFGRHFRLDSKFKIVIGKNESDNLKITALAQPGDLIFTPHTGIKGPVTVVRGKVLRKYWEKIASMLLRYCDIEDDNKYLVLVRTHEGKEIGKVKAIRMSPNEVSEYTI